MPLHDPIDLSATLAIGAVLVVTTYALVCSLLIVAGDLVRRRRVADAPGDPAYA
jgi:hypothetical protein